MGAWGHGHFEDDSALDFMIQIEESDNPGEIIAEVLEAAIIADYLETDEGNAVIVAAAYIDSQVNGTKFSSTGADESLDVDTFPGRHPELDFSELRGNAVIALQRVMTTNSELNDLWEDNEELYPYWKTGIEQLIQRLDK